MKDEIKEIFNKYGKSHYDDKYCLEFETYIIELQELKTLYDYINNLQEENKKKNKIINGIENFIKYLDNNTSNFIVNTTYKVILGKLKKLKIDYLGGDE